MSDYVIAKYIRLSIDDVQSNSMSIENQRLILDAHIMELDIPNAEIIEKLVEKVLVNSDKSVKVHFKFADLFGGDIYV